MERLKKLPYDDEATIVLGIEVKRILDSSSLSYKQSLALSDFTLLVIKKSAKDLAILDLQSGENPEIARLDFEEKRDKLIDEEFAVEKKMTDASYREALQHAITVFNKVFEITPMPITVSGAVDITTPNSRGKYKHLVRMISAANAIATEIARERTLN